MICIYSIAFRRDAVTFEERHAYARLLIEGDSRLNPAAEPEALPLMTGGPLGHRTGNRHPQRSRFSNDSHGPRGRRPVRPMGMATIRRMVI
jgi:hypothetical protein